MGGRHSSGTAASGRKIKKVSEKMITDLQAMKSRASQEIARDKNKD